jgi:transposase
MIVYASAMAYSMDFRERVARAHEESGSSAEVAETFCCSESWVRRLTQQLRETGSLAPKSSARTDDQRTYNDKDDATLAEVVAAIGKPASLTAACRTLQRLKLPRKKSPRMPQSGIAPTS